MEAPPLFSPVRKQAKKHFMGCTLLQDFTTVFFPSFHIPLSAKYVMAVCASLPGYLLKRRG
jgi:hypothetical protein